MSATNDFFIDIAYSQKQKHKQEICGDVFLTKKIANENRTIAVLSDGLGSGVKANILASMTASMVLNFRSYHTPLAHTANIIMETLPIDRERKISFSSFTIVEIDSDHIVHIMEYGNPEIFCIRDNKLYSPQKTEIRVKNKFKLKQKLYYSHFKGFKDDRIITCSDGVTQSGIGSPKYPFGWDRESIFDFITSKIEKDNSISSSALSHKILTGSHANDAYKAKDDITAGVIYLREPRRLMLCSGPPYSKEKDNVLANSIDEFRGVKIICGGTTANIVARELNREITTNMSQISKGLPPASAMENIDLITEGILTIGKALTLLEQGYSDHEKATDPASEICNLLLANDEIYFLIGTKINEAHQDPALPVELEIRRNVIKKIAKCLEDKYLKKVIIDYI